MLRLDIAYMHAKFNHPSFSRSRDMVGASQDLYGLRDLTTPPSVTVCYPWASTCYDQPWADISAKLLPVCPVKRNANL